MNESDKIEFKKEHGTGNYLIINKYDLWNVDLKILIDLDHEISDYFIKKFFNNLETYYKYVDLLGLKNWDREKLKDLIKANICLISFRSKNLIAFKSKNLIAFISKNFENDEAFKEKLRLEIFLNDNREK